MKLKRFNNLNESKGFDFRRVGGAKLDCMYLHLIYEGGDADTRHPEKIKLPWKYSEYKDHIEELNELIDKYKRLEKVLHCGSYGGRICSERINGQHKYVIKAYRSPDVEIEDDLQDLIDDVPNDPQTDYDTKCYLGHMTLIAYDQEGNKLESYI